MPPISNQALGTQLQQNSPRNVTAVFRGGTHDGQVMALPDAQPFIEFPVINGPQWYIGVDPGLPQTIDTEIYRAVQRTITYDPAATISATTVMASWPNITAATNYTIQIEYTPAGTVTDAYAANGSWLGHTDGLQQFAPPLTPEQEAARARKWVRQERRKVLAHKRARRLLLNLLSEEQQQEYAQSKTFTVVAKNGKIFRLRKGKTAELLGADGAAVAAYCIHLPYGYNHEDTLIALLLSLQTDPAEFERVANVTQLQRPADLLAARVETELAGMDDARRVARYRAEHVRESQAMLRAEGLSEAEIEALREWPNHRDGILVAA